MTINLTKYQRIEGVFHLLFWLFIFTAVNVNWHHNWFDGTSRPDSPAPLSVICFPVLFYLHAFWSIPRFLANKKLLKYGLSLILIFVIPELVRISLYATYFKVEPGKALFGRDSFLFGPPGIAWLSFISSLIYKLLADKLSDGNYNYEILTAPPKSSLKLKQSPAEIQFLNDSIYNAMTHEKLFLSTELSLASLAAYLNVSEKKLSAFINQTFNTGFTDFVNEHRINHFISEVEAGKLQNLNMSGLALQCGFSSKVTFYRAFRKIKGCTPSEYFNI